MWEIYYEMHCSIIFAPTRVNDHNNSSIVATALNCHPFPIAFPCMYSSQGMITGRRSLIVIWIPAQDSGHWNWNQSPHKEYAPHLQFPEAWEMMIAPWSLTVLSFDIEKHGHNTWLCRLAEIDLSEMGALTSCKRSFTSIQQLLIADILFCSLISAVPWLMYLGGYQGRVRSLQDPNFFLLAWVHTPSCLHKDSVSDRAWAHSSDPNLPRKNWSSRYSIAHLMPLCPNIHMNLSARAFNIFMVEQRPKGRAVSMYQPPFHYTNLAISSMWGSPQLCVNFVWATRVAGHHSIHLPKI